MMHEVIMVDPVPHEYSGHPAKMHQRLAAVLVEDYSAPGARVLDPFAGIGTVPRAAWRLARVGMGIELEAAYCERAAALGTQLTHGDARDVLPTLDPVDLVLTSPPYGEMIGRAGDRAPAKTAAAKARYEIKRFGSVVSDHAQYGNLSPGNLGGLPLQRTDPSVASFVTAFPPIVARMAAVLVEGGRAVFVVKDQRLGRRELGAFDLFAFVREAGQAAGLVYEGRRVAVLPPNLTTQWQRVNAARWCVPVPNAEHVCVLRKPKGRSDRGRL